MLKDVLFFWEFRFFGEGSEWILIAWVLNFFSMLFVTCGLWKWFPAIFRGDTFKDCRFCFFFLQVVFEKELQSQTRIMIGVLSFSFVMLCVHFLLVRKWNDLKKPVKRQKPFVIPLMCPKKKKWIRLRGRSLISTTADYRHFQVNSASFSANSDKNDEMRLYW